MRGQSMRRSAGTEPSRATQESVLACFRSAVASAPDEPAIHYFDRTLTWREVDAAAGALAALLRGRGFGNGDRLALCVQNDPAFVIGLIAAWKAEGIVAIISPMSKAAEFSQAVSDLRPRALLCLDDVYVDVVRGVLGAVDDAVQIIVTVSQLDFQARDDRRMFSETAVRRRPADTVDLARLVAQGPVHS